MDFDYKILGERISKRRKELGWTQSSLAAHIGISESHMSYIERGETKFSVDYLAAIANAFDSSADSLLYGTAHSAGIHLKVISDLLADFNNSELIAAEEHLVSLKGILRGHVKRMEKDSNTKQ